MKEKLIPSQNLKAMNPAALPSKAGDLSRDPFWYYTSLSTADKILEGKEIYIRSIAQMNDKDECDSHPDRDYVHCLCFCNSRTEKIPMWYLYSGIAGNGVSIGLKPSSMLKLISSIEMIKGVDDGRMLRKGIDFDMEFGWVFYQKKDSLSQVNYRRQWYTLSDPNGFANNNYFIKSYPWEYEKEFRIVFHNKTGQKYKFLAIDLESVYSKLEIKLAPEISDEDFKRMMVELPGFLNYFTSLPSHSNLGINMDLFHRNFDSFIDYIRRNPDSLNKKQTQIAITS